MELMTRLVSMSASETYGRTRNGTCVSTYLEVSCVAAEKISDAPSQSAASAAHNKWQRSGFDPSAMVES